MLVGDKIRRVAIIGGTRIPFARQNSAYFGVSNQEMFTAALNGLVDKYNLAGKTVGEVVGGAVLKHSKDFNLIRECVLGSKLAPETPAYDLQQACSTGMQSIFVTASKIALGQIDNAIAGGVDTASDAPIAVNEKARKIFLQINKAKTTGDKVKLALKLLNPALMAPNPPSNGEPRTGLSMGGHQALTNEVWKIAREAQDELAFNSHKNSAAAYEAGFFDDMIVPFKGLKRDNNLRPDSTLEKLATLKPVFGGPNGTMTAANSTPLTDGASCVFLASEEWAKENGYEPMAYITYTETAAVDFLGKKEGLLMAPAYAASRMLDRAGLALQDFDFYEIHEAFAGQVLSTLKAWESEDFCKNQLGRDGALGSIDRSKLNTKGSSLAAGHPFAATGGRVFMNAAKILKENGGGRCFISICAAGGQGTTAIIESA
ncbi:MAG: acetyl-CoA C-acetyltransferase [Pseudomonadota bacterium]|nr:acetyl-CoA C-acetyltransferase [Pseudomonadota bacterium]